MELSEYVRVLRKQWLLMLLCATLAVAAALVVTLRTTPLYRTGVTFFVSTPEQSADTSSAYTGGLFSQQRVKSYARVVAGPSTAARIATGLGVAPGLVVGTIQASAVPDTVLLSVTVTNASRDTALRIAERLAVDFPQIVAELERPAGGGQSGIRASLTERPSLPGSAFTPRPLRNLSLALVLGLLLGVGLAVLREALDNTVNNPEDVLEHSGTATLGAIAFDPNASKQPLIVHDRPRAARAEAFRQLRTNLQFVEPDTPLRSFVITSSVPNEGKSTLACNLALTLAQAGVRVCLVEGDLRRPRIADYLGLVGAVGVTDVVIGKVTLNDALQPWGDGTITVLASGPLPPNPSELLSSRGMRRLLADLEGRFEVVIVDAPPLLPVTDAAILATITNGAVLTVRSRSTRKEQLRRATDALHAVDATILGSVLNMVPRRGPDAYGGYGYGYGYGYGAYDSDKNKPQLSHEDALLVTHGAPPAAPAPSLRERAVQPAVPEPVLQPVVPALPPPTYDAPTSTPSTTPSATPEPAASEWPWSEQKSPPPRY